LNFHAVVYDGAAPVNILQPKTCKTFSQYATETFCPFILKQVTEMRCTRVYVVWDCYHQGSLKTFTRTMRGEGTRRQVKGPYPVPRNWSDADAYIEVLSRHVKTVSTKGAGIVSSCNVGTNLSHCSQEEADTRVLLHVADVVRNGRMRVVRTVDSDHLMCLFCVLHITPAYPTSQNCGLHLVQVTDTDVYRHT